ncbi:MAG: bifunctional glutamate N-acetyltransferase/amino-acid acetyltransferase ArgJ [Proteobacteria bacterium]|nr:bifunctional glutamate N-acetyltransferase/amino-acid acetyltransferase ArgJ [Pseudomonadota bacterium]MBU1595945.1 bifunctional glutamate N-acetyltransferase/amino-acid acetyltransferase ArgJ [Pseudomonadota bacterium]
MTLVPKGYRFAVAAAGFKKADRNDLGLILSVGPAVAAGVFTTNRFQAAPVLVCKEILADSPVARAIVVNSGQANACTGEEGLANCRATLDIVAKAARVEPAEILPTSTGVIGAQLKMDLWAEAGLKLAGSLGRATPMDVAKAMMTTDSFPKLVGRSVQLSGGEVRVLGMCKGAGMICPQMATMLGFVLCDADVDPRPWREMLSAVADKSFNALTVDGDTSTNDTVLALSNGASRVRAESKADLELLRQCLLSVCQELSYRIVQDAEGGTKVAHITVCGAKSHPQAEMAARAIGNSPLVKTALFGCDPNWGRIIAALGRSGADFDPREVVLKIGGILVFENGQPSPEDLDALLAPCMRHQDVQIELVLGQGRGTFTLLASDLTKRYVEINADYRT